MINFPLLQTAQIFLCGSVNLREELPSIGSIHICTTVLYFQASMNNVEALDVEAHQLQQLKEIFPDVEENALIAATQDHIELNDILDAIMAGVVNILHYTLTC